MIILQKLEIKKIKELDKSVIKFKNDQTYEFRSLLADRDFFFKAI